MRQYISSLSEDLGRGCLNLFRVVMLLLLFSCETAIPGEFMDEAVMGMFNV